MPKGPKFKRGFTLRHHWDEWWDRRPQEVKAKIFVGLAVVFLIASAVCLTLFHDWTEKNEFLNEAKRVHQSRIEASDKLIAPKFDPQGIPSLRNGDGPQTRPGQ